MLYVIYRFNLVLLSLVIQVFSIFSDWWIGSVSDLPWALSQTEALYIYIGLTAAIGLLFAIGGLVTPVVSDMAATNLSTQVCLSVTHAKFEWYTKTTSTNVASYTNHDDA